MTKTIQWQRKKCYAKKVFYLTVGVVCVCVCGLVVMVMMLSLLDFKIQSKRSSFQAFATRYEDVIVLQETRIGWLTVYEPGQMGGGLGSARCAINVHFIANLIPRTSTAYFWTNFWQHWKCFDTKNVSGVFFLRLAHSTKHNRDIIFLVLHSRFNRIWIRIANVYAFKWDNQFCGRFHFRTHFECVCEFE